MNRSLPRPVMMTAGWLLWAVFVWVKGADLQSVPWVEVLLLFSPLVLMPLAAPLLGGLEGIAVERRITGGAFVLVALLQPMGHWLGTVAAAGWLICCIMEAGLAWNVMRKAALLGERGGWCLLMAAVFPTIGAAWLVANRANWMPFGFDALVVLLTAAHFHHAGFTLPLMTGLAARQSSGRLAAVACSLILLGVPAVAAGITFTHFKLLSWVEPAGVALLVAGALGTAVLQLSVARAAVAGVVARMLLVISALSLSAAMLLALGFGLRMLLPQWALPMPSMWAVHGTLNTFGFGLAGITGWRLLRGGK